MTKRKTPVPKEYFTAKHVSGNVLSDERYQELLREWTANPLQLSVECLCNTIGTLTDRILAGDIIVLPANKA